MLLFKYFKDASGEYLGIRDEYVYYVFIPATNKKEQIITLFSFAYEKIEKHYLENKEEIHQMKLFMTPDPLVVERISAVTNYQRIFNISHEEFLETFPG
ncbi:hypothetical protein [Paenisporosarcina indica]|uniref:hypothetical protein n=1 Tax=Paenisporosarcina indica TaxID=650093 RepID=UPI00094F739F|nr:hypothetical protein [Paenisporosarcina indica]